ncbi:MULTISPECIES: pectate lyase [unclassified Streptomyces]|uniref:pectate lyase n=1 Tax=unclassified Streptomyces TaxID=2593676 RepID=UPI002E798209|nr:MULTISPECIES: pectate lyase [unclassified Streptomyces]MEE1762026.1 pectate lyase [Streptomyces sp. SP18BB07]MEE1830441.1 pectate lyase [Streptomyces sp. SP17KL33]
MTSAARPRARTRALTGTFAAFSLSFGMIMTSGATPANAATWPSANGSQPVSSTISVSGTRDGGMVRYYGSGALAGDGQEEGQDPIFKLAAGATLKNVIIGAPGADGIHCEGNCTLQNVWWEDVGEDAATFRGGSTYTVTGGGAKKAADKVFQHNGPGTVNISNFAVSDFKTLYRSCGDCSTQYTRKVNLSNIEVTGTGTTARLVGINVNRGDVATLRGITILNDSGRKVIPCQKYNNTTAVGTGPDSTNCKYATSDITYR